MTLCSYGRCQNESEWSFPYVNLCQEHWIAWCTVVFWAATLREMPPRLREWAAVGVVA